MYRLCIHCIKEKIMGSNGKCVGMPSMHVKFSKEQNLSCAQWETNKRILQPLLTQPCFLEIHLLLEARASTFKSTLPIRY